MSCSRKLARNEKMTGDMKGMAVLNTLLPGSTTLGLNDARHLGWIAAVVAFKHVDQFFGRPGLPW
jgi:hypothetical protein